MSLYRRRPKTSRWLSRAAVAIVSVGLLLLIYRPDGTFQFWMKLYQAVTDSEHPDQPRVPPQCGPGWIVPEGQKVAVDRTKTVLTSAYLEHRTEDKEDKLHVSRGDVYIHWDHFDFAYGTADIMCPLPPGCETISHIAVTRRHSDKRVKEFLEVKNQQTADDSFLFNYTVCISTMFDFTNVLQLVQSLEMLQLLGVNRVVIYRHSNSPETQRVLDYYVNKGLVEVVPWSFSRFLNVSRGWLPYHGPGELHYFGQIPALNDCVYRYMYRSRYVALHDVDELILPQMVDSWSELVPLLDWLYGGVQCFLFENNVFPTNVILPPPAWEPLAPQSPCCPGWLLVPGVDILSHLYQEPITEGIRYTNYKAIVNPRAVFTVTVHGVLSSLTGCVWVDRNISRMYHTRAPKQPGLTPDQLVYDGRLLSYSREFTLAVNGVLSQCGFLPRNSPT